MCTFFGQHELLSHYLLTLLHLLGFQNLSRGGAPTIPSLRGATQSAATVARFSYHQLCWYLVSGSSHCPTRGSSGEFLFAGSQKLLLRNNVIHTQTQTFLNDHHIFGWFSPCSVLPFCFVSSRLVTCLAKVCTLLTWCPRVRTTVTPPSQTLLASYCWLRLPSATCK